MFASRLEPRRTCIPSGALILEAGLLPALGPGAGPEHGPGRIQEHALPAKAIQQLAIVAHQKADPLELAHGGLQHPTRRSVYVVCGLIETQHGCVLPKCGADLGPLAFAVAQALPSIVPVVPKVELPAKPPAQGIRGGQESLQALWREVGALGTEDDRAGAPDGSFVERQLSRGQAKKRGLARSIRSDDTGPTGREAEREVLEEESQRRIVGKGNVLKQKEGPGHGAPPAASSQVRHHEGCLGALLVPHARTLLLSPILSRPATPVNYSPFGPLRLLPGAPESALAASALPSKAGCPCCPEGRPCSSS